MREIYARCGNRCDLCPLYKDNFSAADADKVNEDLYKYHHSNQGPRPHYTRACDGCLSNGYVARENCRIRDCVASKAFVTCAECDQLFCTLLKADMEIIESALVGHGMSMSSEDCDKYFRPFLIRETLLSLRSRQQQNDKPMKD